MKVSTFFNTDNKPLEAGDILDCELRFGNMEFMVVARENSQLLTIIPLCDSNGAHITWFNYGTRAIDIPKMYERIFACTNTTADAVGLESGTIIADKCNNMFAIVRSPDLHDWKLISINTDVCINRIECSHTTLNKRDATVLLRNLDSYAIVDLSVKW
jgi:hypothetical protein